MAQSYPVLSEGDRGICLRKYNKAKVAVKWQDEEVAEAFDVLYEQ